MLWDLFSAFAVALLFTLIFVAMFAPGPRIEHAAAFFVMVFLASWAGGLWFGYTRFELAAVFWLPYFVIGLLFGLMLAAVLATRVHLRRESKVKINVLLWVLIAVLLALVVSGYLLPPEVIT